MKLRTWVLNMGPRQSAIISLTSLWATESMCMILTPTDCERTGNRGLLQIKGDSIWALCCRKYAFVLCLGTRLWLNKTHSTWLLSQTYDCYRRLCLDYKWLDDVNTDPCSAVGDCQIFEGARKYAMKYHTFQTLKIVEICSNFANKKLYFYRIFELFQISKM